MCLNGPLGIGERVAGGVFHKMGWEARGLRGWFTCRFVGEWTYILGLGAGRWAVLPHQEFPMEPSLHGYLANLLAGGFCLSPERTPEFNNL